MANEPEKTPTEATDLVFGEQFEPDLFWEENGRKIIYGVLGVVVVVGAVYFWQQQKAGQAAQAAARLTAAKDPEALERVIADYAGQQPAAQALLLLGDMQYQKGQFTEAEKQYSRFLKEFPQHELAPSALLGLAAIQEATGNLAAAQSAYQQIVSSSATGYAGLEARLGAARCAEAQGQTKEARQMYEELLALARGSALEGTVYLRWSVLGRETGPIATNAPPAGVVAPKS